ncbi:MAG: NAD(P)-dependent oxidoreductase [Cyanobacteriota bacterium]|nr:NAD(P)-dependent oxidoreductase [Cyanobacteriota bacterium]
MARKRIFITGGSGCIGHYIAETLIENTEHELFFLVRDPNKLMFDFEVRSGVSVLPGDLREVDRMGEFLGTMDCAILAAAAWGGAQECFDINVAKTCKVLELLDRDRCEQAIYFSTASLLGRDNQLLPEAARLGTEYIRSKYDCAKQLPRLQIYPRITTLYPTLVLGGDQTKPTSHLSSGIPEVVKWINLIRFFKVSGSFHFIHGRDIAEVVRYLVDNPPGEPTQWVLGNQPYTVDRAISEVCAYLRKSIYFRIPLFSQLINFFIVAFNVQMAAWDRFCLDYRHFTYQEPVNSKTLGLLPYCETMADVLRVSGIRRG